MTDFDSTDVAEPFDPFAGPAITRVVDSTEAQREIWSAAQMGRGASLAYNEAIRLTLAGSLDAPALAGALDDLLGRHEALRSTFSADGLKVLVGDATSVDLRRTDLAALSEAERTARREEARAAAVRTEFDLQQGPLFRAELLRLGVHEHELLLTAHHIVCDGWSFGVIAGDLAALYNARVAHHPASLPQAPSFTDYAVDSWHAARGQARLDDEAFWLGALTAPLPVLDLPSDRPRPALKTFDAGREDRVVPEALAQAVRAAGARAGSSLFATLLGGFATLLHRLSSHDDLVIGVPSAGQSASGMTGLVGHCVNMLPIRLRPVGTQPFATFLSQVRAGTLDAFEHQQLSFGSLVARLALPRDPSRIPLVSVLFNVDRSLPASAMVFTGLTVRLDSIPRAFENFDLFLNAIETEDGLVLECQYNADLFDAATVQRWLASYEVLLTGIVADPTQPLGALPVLTDADRAALASCNDTALALPAETLVHRLIEAQAARTPDAVAVLHDGTGVTYAELNRRANQLARHLRALGVQRGALVGLCLERTPDLLVALLAALKAGAGYVPLDPNYPADRLSYMAGDAALAVLVADGTIAAELALPAQAQVLFDRDATQIASHDGHDLPDTVDDAQPEDTAYVIYTSGSTGKPKGVLVPHRSVVNLLTSVRHEPGLGAHDVVLAITTLSFDIAVSELILPLTVGARIVLASRDTASDGASLQQLLESTGVTFIDATPATYRLLLAAGWRGTPGLRVICTGEAMPRDLAETLVTCADEVWNGYGPTETTVWSTFARVTAPVRRVLIGRPVANTTVRILDAMGQQVPIGVPGELFIAGRGVSNGYLNRDDLTAERFVADPAAPGARQYRTGDLVRLLATGELECLGRNDNQVKVRGFRIEPGEIEVVLMRHPGVREAVVIAREDRVNDVRLVAYLVTDAEDVVSDALRAFAKGALPDYMVPATYVRMDAMPLTPSGKVDRKALPAPQAPDPSSQSRDFVAPATPTETIIAEVFAAVLGQARVSVVDDFFALGGHSLLASQALARLRRDHGITLSFRKVFEAPTVRRLAAIVDEARAAAGGSGTPAAAAVAIPHRTEQGSAPLSVLQERLWLLEELEPAERTAHAHSASWRLFGALDVARLERAFAALIARHDILRTSFDTIDGQRRQVVARSSAFTLAQRDLSAMAPAEQESTLEAFFREQQHTPFDLGVAPLYRACLFRLTPEHHLLYSLQHGMVWDGWCFDLFLKELTEFYAADEAGRAPVLDALPVTYGDFAAWQPDWLASDEARGQGEWWRRQLSGDAAELALATDFPRPARSGSLGRQISVPFSPEEVERFRAFARQQDSTLFMVVFAAYNVMLHHYSGQTDLLVGSPVRARTRPELEGILGPFVNTVMLRTRVTPDMTFSDLLKVVRDGTLDAFSNQELPFELLGTRVPPLRALFSMQDARERPAAMGSLRVEQYHVPQYFTTNDLMMWMMDTRTKLHAVLNFSTELFTRETAERFLQQLRAFLLAVIEAPDRRVRDIPLGDETGAPAPRPAPGGSVLEGIVAHVARTPERAAVRAGRTTLSWGELTVRAARVASWLSAHGLGAGNTVAVQLPADASRVVAVLGVLQAGAAVLLLDPDDASAYTESMIRRLAPQCVIGEDDDDDIGSTRMVALPDLLRTDATSIVTPAAQAPAVVLALQSGVGAWTVRTLDHAALGAQVTALAESLAIGPSDAVVVTLPAGSPMAVQEMLAPLAAGATLVMASDDAGEDAEDLRARLEDVGATALSGTGELWRRLLGTPWSARAGFRGTLVAGALPAHDMLGQYASRVSHAGSALVLPLHGLVATGVVREGDGRLAMDDNAAAGWTVGVGHADGHMAPTGIPGSLRVGGVDASAELVPVRARRLADRRVQLLGEDADVVWCDGAPVRRGALIEALRAGDGISDAAVAVHGDAAGIPRLVAYLVGGPGARITDIDVRAAMRRHMPVRAVPHKALAIASVPRDAAGGVRLEQLRSPYSGPGAVASSRTAPRDDTERVLAAAWQSVLGVPAVSIHDNFFQIGGTSLLCFRVVEYVRNATGQRLNPRALLVGTLEQAAVELAATPAAPRAPDPH